MKKFFFLIFFFTFSICFAQEQITIKDNNALEVINIISELKITKEIFSGYRPAYSDSIDGSLDITIIKNKLFDTAFYSNYTLGNKIIYFRSMSEVFFFDVVCYIDIESVSFPKLRPFEIRLYKPLRARVEN